MTERALLPGSAPASFFSGDAIDAQPWGYLLPLWDGPLPLELRRDITTVGTSDACTLQVDPVTLRLPAAKSPQILFQVRRERLNRMAILQSQVFVLRIDRGEKIPRDQPVELEHGACIAFEGDEQSYVYVNRELSESFAAPPKVLAKFLVGHCLGYGGFGKVYTLFDIENKTQRKAMKIVEPMNVRQVPYAEREVRILMSLEHPCVIKTISVEHLHHQHFLIMEYMAGGDLGQFVNEQHLLSEQQTKLIFFQLALAIEYLHEKDICHRDLKPTNILLQDRRPNTLIKVTDFGVAKCGNVDTSMTTFLGTKPFMAPEITCKDKYSNSVDVWSMGVILFYSLTGVLPFANLEDALNRKHVVEYQQSHWLHVSSNAFQLVRNMLQVNAADRVSVSQVIEDLWLRDGAMRENVFQLTGLEKYRLNISDLGDYQSHWGYLLPLLENHPVLELNKRQVTVGTAANCTLRLDATALGLPSDSTFCTMNNDEYSNAFLTTRSNCVFLNGRGLPQRWKRWKMPLENGMKISFQRIEISFIYVNRKVSTSLEITERYEKEYWVFDSVSEGNIGKENEYILLEKKPNYQEKILKVVHVLPMNEMKIEWKAKKLLTLKHPCLVELFSYERLQSNRFLIMDYMNGGDLSDFVNSQRFLTEPQTKLLFFQLALAMEYLHRNNTNYRSWNLRNILLQNRSPHTLIKVSTVALLNDVSNDRSAQKSEDFLANIFIDSHEPFSKELDVYCMGIILLYSLTGYHPFKSSATQWQGVSMQARALAAAMLKKLPIERPCVLAVLKDPWLEDETMRGQVSRLTGLDIQQMPRATIPDPILDVPIDPPSEWMTMPRFCTLLYPEELLKCSEIFKARGGSKDKDVDHVVNEITNS